MSYLSADNRQGRSQSRSRERSRSRSNVRAPKGSSPPSSAAYGYAPPSASSAMPGSFNTAVTSPTYEVRSPGGAPDKSNYFPSTSSAPPSHYPPPQTAPYPAADGGFTMGDYSDFPPHERPGYKQSQQQYPSETLRDARDLAYGDNSGPYRDQSRHQSYSDAYSPQHQNPVRHAETTTTSSYRYTPQPNASDPRSDSYTYQYAQPSHDLTYTDKPQSGPQRVQHTEDPRGHSREQLSRKYSDREDGLELRGGSREQLVRKFSESSYREEAEDPRARGYRQPTEKYADNSYRQSAQVVDMTPGHDRRERTSSATEVHRLSVSTRQTSLQAPISPGLGPRMNRLSVSGNRPDIHALGGGGGLPPPSPLLEAYHGTYQSISPMPLALRPEDDDELSDLDLSPSVSRNGHKGRDLLERDVEREKEKKRVKLYDPEEDAKKIAKALNHHTAQADPIIDILPHLSHDQIFELRREYKKQVKIQGKGINLPKHLKMKLTGNFGKVAYVTALGRWESEGYWANFWYQSHGSRRELLIESLMGRTNAEIRNIKDEFKDKRYSDSLVKCMEKELKMDKFRKAVLMVLEERRQEELDVLPIEYRNRDVEMLHRALTAKEGGESAMLEIIVRRSDAHLREVLRTYERMHGENFARVALKKSNNLVGEVIAHILNGVINKPARDALLLQHAIKDVAERNKDDELRYELLISRLVRLHWDPTHLLRVKRTYAERYRHELEKDIEDATKGDFSEFLCELCGENR